MPLCRLDMVRLAWVRDVRRGVSVRFTYGMLDGVPQREALFMDVVRDGASQARRFDLLFDHLGSMRGVRDENGLLVKKVEYDCFGNVTFESGEDMFVPIGFAGGLIDPDHDLIHFCYRDYDPDVGRWTATDPIGKAGGDPDLYGYCLDDPVNAVDPLGLAWEGWKDWKSRGEGKRPQYLKPDLRHRRVYDTPEKAMNAAYDSIYDRSQKQGREWGGIVYKADGGGYFTEVTPGEQDKVGLSIFGPLEGVVSMFHTHQPGNEPDLTVGDFVTSNDLGKSLYMKNYLGRVQRYDPVKDEVSELRAGRGGESFRSIGSGDDYLGVRKGLLYRKGPLGDWYRRNRL